MRVTPHRRKIMQGAWESRKRSMQAGQHPDQQRHVQRYRTVRLKVSPFEWERLEQEAKDKDTDVAELVRTKLFGSGSGNGS